MAEPVDVKSTLNLPQTAFAMKAKLTQKEPELLKKWSETGLYSRFLTKHAADPTFVLHDGPPYANGSIHYAAGTGWDQAYARFCALK